MRQLLIGLVAMLWLVAGPSLSAATILVAEEFYAARDQGLEGIGTGVLGAAFLGRNGPGEDLRPVAEFDIDSVRAAILDATSIILSFTVDELNNIPPANFSGIDILLLNSTNGVVIASDFQEPGVAVDEDIPVAGLADGSVISVDVTSQLQAQAANPLTDYVAFRLQIATGENADKGEWIDFTSNDPQQDAFLTIVPEPAAFGLAAGAMLLALVRRRRRA